MAFPVKEITMVKVSKESNMIPGKPKFKHLGTHLVFDKNQGNIYIYFPYTVNSPISRQLRNEQKLSIKNYNV